MGRLTIFLLVLFSTFKTLPAHAQIQNIQFGEGVICDGQWVQDGLGQRCVCPDGSNAKTVNDGQSWHQTCAYGQQQQQYQPQPDNSVSCGGWNCPLGTSCSRVSYGVCINPGFTECARGGTCPPGNQCTSDNRCMPTGNIECGSHSCTPGAYCGSRNQCMAEGSADCGNGSSCSNGQKCSRDGKHCVPQDTVDCGSYFCNSGAKCGSANTCLSLSDVDCGAGRSCSAGQVCRKGGGCATKEELAAEQAAAQERRRAEAQAKKDEIARQKAAELEKAAAAKEAVRIKEEERKQAIAQQKADAEAKKMEQARLKEEARLAAIKKIEDDKAMAKAKADEQKRLKEEAQAAALKAAQDKVAEQKRLLAEQQEITRLQKEAQQLAAQVKAEAEARAKDVQSVPKIANGNPLPTAATLPPAAAGNTKATGGTAQRSAIVNGEAENKMPSASPAHPNIQTGQVSSAEIDLASLKKMANDPTQLPAIRQLATALLINEYGSAATTGNGPTKANQIALQAVPISIAQLQNRTTQSLAQNTGAQTTSNPVEAARDSLHKTLNDPNQPIALRQIAAMGLGLNPATVQQGIPSKAATNANLAASTNAGQGGTPLKLNSDVKNDVVSLQPSEQMQQQNASISSKPSSASAQSAQSTFMAGSKGTASPASTGNCLARAWKETTTGQVALPSAAAAGKKVAVDAASAFASTVTSSSSFLGKAQTGFGLATTASSIDYQLSRGDKSMAAADLVESTTIQSEQALGDRIGGPILGGVASGVTQAVTDLGVMYASPVLGNALYDCFPSAFTPK